ncbi:class I SAM-dependent methyltransferase [Massilia sp. GCM10020059]|uniref:Class I SAM-dependent methyltransferase n=1 Tax=Massilia agrisoli TaxID=2892444 RepID=A0ABS8IVF6_9BURK|nr:class I SAM-dependent methyltransferase [Massilia agrisoli]MCC6071853.1 class I SAM-dependent methyltransferase [Massilia agrisoli]
MSLALLRIWRTPALQALLIQAGAFAPALAVIWLLARAGVPVSYLGAAFVHGLLAAALTWWRGLARWWCAIQFAFPLALYGALMLELPPLLFLAAFVFLLTLYWSTFRTQVPYYPSGKRAWDEVAALLPKGRAVSMIDIGSGLGGLVLDMARRRPESRFTGIELAPLPWLASRIRAAALGSSAHFIRGDYEQLDFGDYDLVFAYLSPAAMGALWRKASAEMRPGAMLVSYEFLITEKAPDLTITPIGRGPNVFVWHF